MGKLREGWLVKKPVHERTFGRAQRRWFVLTDDTIEWFNTDDPSTYAKGRLGLTGQSTIERRGSEELILRSAGKTLVLKGEGLDDWELSLRSAVTAHAVMSVPQEQQQVAGVEERCSEAESEASSDAEPPPLEADDRADEAGDRWTPGGWAQSMPIGEAIAHARNAGWATGGVPPLPTGDTGDPALELLRDLGRDEGGGRDRLLSLLRCGGVTERLVDVMWPGVQQLATAGAATASELHDKFVQQGEGLDLGFGDIDTFFGGLEGIVGAPNPMIQTGMTRDHCEGEDADEPYVSSNYKMRTTSRVEWWFVFDPKEGLAKNEDRAAGWKHLAASFANLGGVTAYPVEDPSTISGSAKPREAVLLSAFESDMHSMSK
jgi:hypothetical protein